MQTSETKLKDDFKTVKKTVQHTCKCCKETSSVFFFSDQPVPFKCSCGVTETVNYA